MTPAPRRRTACLLVAGLVAALAGCGEMWWDKLDDKELKTSVRADQAAFDPSASTWAGRPGLPILNPAQTGTVGASGRLYVVAGGSSAAMRFDPLANFGAGAWEALPDLPEARADAEAVAVGTTIAIASGYGAGGPIAFVEVLDDSAATPTWERVPAPFKRYEAAVVAAQGKLFVAGGRDQTGAVSKEIWELMPVSPGGTWTLRGSMSTARTLAGGFAVGNRLHVVSGHAGDGVPLLSEDVFNFVTNTVETQASPVAIPTARLAPQAVVIGSRALVTDARILAVGPSGRLDSFTDAEGWTSKAPDPVPLAMSSAAPAGSLLLVAGGLAGVSSGRAFLYDPAADTWTETAGMPFARHAGLLAEVGGGRTNYAGGYETRKVKKSVDWTDFFGF